MHTQQPACTWSRSLQFSSDTMASPALPAILPPGASGGVNRIGHRCAKKDTRMVGHRSAKRKSTGVQEKGTEVQEQGTGVREKGTEVQVGGDDLNKNALVYAHSSRSSYFLRLLMAAIGCF